MLIGLLLPAVTKVREAALRQQMAADLNKTFCQAMHKVFNDFGDYPLTLSDERLLNDLPPHSIDQYIDTSGGIVYYDPLGFQLTLTTTPGIKNDDSSWDFKLDAIRAQLNLSSGVAHPTVTGVTLRLDKNCGVTFDPGGVPGGRAPIPQGGLTLAAVTIVPLLEQKPEMLAQVRHYTSQPEHVQFAFNLLDTNHDGVVTIAELDANAVTAPFAPLYHTPSVFGREIDAQIAIHPSDLTGDSSFLFSYEALRQLTTFYLYHRDKDDDHEGHEGDEDRKQEYQELVESLNAAEIAENHNHAAEKAKHLAAFQNRVNASVGKWLNAGQAHILVVLSKTL